MTSTTVQTPTLIVATIRTELDPGVGKPTVQTQTLSCMSDAVDPEWRFPLSWFAFMLDTDPRGRETAKTWDRWADADIHPESIWVEVRVTTDPILDCEGTVVLDSSGVDIADALEWEWDQAERAVVNP